MSRASSRHLSPRAGKRVVTARRSPRSIILGGLLVVVLIAAAVAVAISGMAASSSPELVNQPVRVAGPSLPALSDPATDAAIGQAVPRISGVGMDGQPLEIGPDDGPMVIVVLAHWCPHCQAELPGLAEYLARGALPNGVAVVGVSTAIDPSRPNYPPSAWFERERWTQPTLVDDPNNTALDALGLNSFPGFVFVGADGTVVQRLTGEIGVDRFAQIIELLAP